MLNKMSLKSDDLTKCHQITMCLIYFSEYGKQKVEEGIEEIVTQ